MSNRRAAIQMVAGLMHEDTGIQGALRLFWAHHACPECGVGECAHRDRRRDLEDLMAAYNADRQVQTLAAIRERV